MELFVKEAKEITPREWIEGLGLASLFAGVIIALLLIA